MPKAKFQTQIGSPVIDEAAGVIRGCRIATLGAVSKSAKDEGGGMVMDSRMIDGLLKLAMDKGNRIPVFFGHEWYDDEKNDALKHDAGVWNSFEKDAAGNLTATFVAFDTPHKAGIFSRASKDPQGIAVSPIFDYSQRNGDVRYCDPLDFISADFVKAGAINKALFSEDPNANKTMDIAELIEALKDPKVQAAVTAIIKSHKADEPDTTDEEASNIETEAGVLAEDKKPEDDKKPALMRAQLRIGRAMARQSKALIDSKAALLEEAKSAGKAEATAFFGKGKFQAPAIGKDGKTDEERFDDLVAAEVAANPKLGVGRAKFNVAQKHPELAGKRLTFVA